VFLHHYYSFNFDCTGKMIPNEKMVYALAALVFVTSLVYFVVAWQAVGETAEAKTSDEKLGNKMEITLFTVVACSYLLMGIWIMKKRYSTSIPYLIVSIGSAIMIGIYLVAITAGVPVLGVESETDPFATIAKTLQGAIIGLSLSMIPYTLRIHERVPRINTR
jgi:cytochrome bd-type quinol oxidase subunit 2